MGLDYTHLCRRVPNTLLSHTLISWAGEASPAKQSAVAEIVFRQYHTEGRYPDEANLVSAAVEVGRGEGGTHLDGAAGGDGGRGAEEREGRRGAPHGHQWPGGQWAQWPGEHTRGAARIRDPAGTDAGGGGVERAEARRVRGRSRVQAPE